jgi:FtsP/CotA-like multicopper oxidase with cupredoxin domain
VIKDAGWIPGTGIDFIADNPGLTLFQCYQQLHMDFGFMALFNYA